MSPVRVPVVVVTYDAPDGVLERCVAALTTVDPGEGVVVEVVVVDNGGRAARRLAAGGLEVDRVVEPADNVGFGAAVNAGVAATAPAAPSGTSVPTPSVSDERSDVVVCLNDDAVVRPGWLAPLLDALGEARVGAVQPVLLQAGDVGDVPRTGGVTDAGDATAAIDAPGDALVDGAGVEIDRYGQGSDRGRGDPVADHAGSSPVRVRAVTGGAAAFSRAFLDDVGGFDERFFLYYEDVELCRRGEAAGWEFRVVPRSRVDHVGSASTGVLGDHRLGLQERNRLWTVALHGSAAEQARAVWLSIRRLRHPPRSVHRRALVAGLRGVPRRWLERVRPAAARRGRSSAAPGGELIRRPLTGVNVVGYHHISSGLGDAAREFSRCLRAAGVDVVDVDNDVSDSPRTREARPVPDLLHDTTVAFVTAFEFPDFRARHPELAGPGRRMIGYWFWELATVPDGHVEAMAALDEIWVATSFVRDAYVAAAERAPRPPLVRLVPLRLPQPDIDVAEVDRWRRRWAGEFVFVVSFDYLSVPERKNPQAAITAFRDAFDDGEVRLVVKSMNRDRRPDDAVAIEALAAGDPRIEFLDAHLDVAEHHGLLAAADCYVSPHRSEGLGLQPALAMWVRTPVIATRYGGVVDFLDDETGFLCGHRPSTVTTGEGVYPVGAPWADVDHDDLVAAMRSVRGDPVRRAAIVDAARRRIEQQGTPADFGRRIRDALTRLDGAAT